MEETQRKKELIICWKFQIVGIRIHFLIILKKKTEIEVFVAHFSNKENKFYILPKKYALGWTFVKLIYALLSFLGLFTYSGTFTDIGTFHMLCPRESILFSWVVVLNLLVFDKDVFNIKPGNEKFVSYLYLRIYLVLFTHLYF